MSIIFSGLWILIGIVSMVYWASCESDLDILDILFLSFVGSVFGPFGLILGWFVHSEPLRLKTIIKKRVKK